MKPVDISEPALLIRIARLYRERMTSEELYEATRGVWKVGEDRGNVELALAVARGIVREVYVVNQWHPAGTTRYATRARKDVEVDGRWEFTGRPASETLRSKYFGRSVAHYFRRSSTNPIFYVNVKDKR